MSPETQCCTGQGGQDVSELPQREGSEADPEVWELQERGEGRKRARVGWRVARWGGWEEFEEGGGSGLGLRVGQGCVKRGAEPGGCAGDLGGALGH